MVKLSVKPQYPDCVATQNILSFLVIRGKRFRYSAVIRVDAVPLLCIFFKRREERVIGTYPLLVSRRSNTTT